MLHAQGLAVEGEVHLEGQPIHKAAEEARGKAQLDTVQFHLMDKALIGDRVFLMGLRRQKCEQVVTPQH